jgi:Neuraminidase (sialidase)
MYSSNGSTWTSTAAGAVNTWNSVCWSQELRIFVAVANAGAGNGVMYSLDGGITWTMGFHPSTSNNFASVCWSPDLNLFVTD